MKYEKPNLEIVEADFGLLCGSGPGADNIGSPNVEDDVKECSIWDEVNDTYNINKEE